MKKVSNQENIQAISYVKRSQNRTKVVTIIGTSMKIPSDIAKIMNLRVNQISAILSDLKKENIVVCINEDAKTGRLYQLTDKGLNVHKFLKSKTED